MTQFLIRCFIKHPEDTASPAVRTAYGNLASVVGMACNLLLCLGKLAAGTLFGSIAIMADALNNLSDASSNLVSLVGFRLAAKAPDEKHPYGHARYEYLAGLVVSVTILGIGFSLLKESAVQLYRPDAMVFSWVSVGVLAASIAVKLWLSGLFPQGGGHHPLRHAAGSSSRQPQRCAEHRRRAAFHVCLPLYRLDPAGCSDGPGCVRLYPLVGLASGAGDPQPPAGRKPVAGAGGAH